jgi:hypothetical protein
MGVASQDLVNDILRVGIGLGLAIALSADFQLIPQKKHGQ